MNTPTRLTTIAALLGTLTATPLWAQSGEGAQVIFTNDRLTLIDAKGVERAVKQGDFVKPGERLITPPGVIGQIKLPDGTLLGARPGSDLKLESTVSTLGKNVVVLNEGNVRVLNIAPPKGPKPMPVDIVSPHTTLKIVSGDGAAIHVKPGDNRANIEPGTYSHLQRGTAVVRNEKGELPLPPMQPMFAGKPATLPAPIDALPTSLVKLEPVILPTPAAATKAGAGTLPELKTPSGTPLTPLPAPIAGALPLPVDPVKPAIGTAPLTGTGNIAISDRLTPMLGGVDPRIIQTATLLKPPAPPPPPPPIALTSPTAPIASPSLATTSAGTVMIFPTALKPLPVISPTITSTTTLSTTTTTYLKCLTCTTFTLIK